VSVAANPRAAWLSEKLVLLAVPGNGHHNGAAKLVGNSRDTITLDARHFEAPSNNGNSPIDVSICRLPATFSRRSSSELAIEQSGQSFNLDDDGFSPAGNDLTTILRTELARLDAPTREELLRFILNAVGEELHGPGGLTLAKNMALIRDVLRERLPYCVVRADEPLGLRIDEVHALDECTFWFKGWLWDVDTPLESLTLVSPEGFSIEALDSAFRYRRLDIEQIYGNTHGERPDSGFLVCVRLDIPSRLSHGWVAQLRNVLGVGVEVKAPPAARGLAGSRELVLGELEKIGIASDQLVADHVRPAIKALQRRIADTTTVERDEWFGTPPVDPQVSIAIPVETRGDTLEKHLIHFGRDPEMAQAELIYLIGSAKISRHLITKAEELQWLYGVPFRLVSLSQMDRPTNKMNIGASLATAPNLLFMSPDVFADSPGWLGRMLAFKADRPDAGAIGPKLVYEDGSIQHAGVYFDRVSRQELRSLEPPDRTVWELRYRLKGLPASFAAAGEPSPVPAISSAAMLIERDLFDSVGRFQNVFVESDYEAADLCLRLADGGRTNWYLPDASLRYLEGRSDAEVPVPPSRYDAMLHSQLWGERMATLADGALR
jgi:hypothetical protein